MVLHHKLSTRGEDIMAEQNHQIRLKNFNRRSVLNYIRKNKTVTKAGLAAATGLTFMAIKRILEELEELKLIRYDEMNKSGMGRHAISYAINEKYKHTIGIHINKYVTSIAVLNLRGEIKADEKISMEREFPNQNAFVELLIASVEKLLNREKLDKEDILGIGVGAPGPVDCEQGVILTPPNIPMLSYLPLKEVLERKTGCPVYVHKDTNVIAFGEYWYGEGNPYEDLVYIDVDMGIGSGLIIDGKLKTGANGIAGEFGHITIDINGPACNCGNRGCLEAMSSGISVLRELSLQLKKEQGHSLYGKRDNLLMEDVFAMTEQNDLLTISILNQSAYYMGIAVSNLINIIDPQMIIMGGIIPRKYPRYFEIVKSVADAGKVKGARENKMTLSSLAENAGVIGAGEIVTDHFFNEKVDEVFIREQSS